MLLAGPLPPWPLTIDVPTLPFLPPEDLPDLLIGTITCPSFWLRCVWPSYPHASPAIPARAACVSGHRAARRRRVRRATACAQVGAGSARPAGRLAAARQCSDRLRLWMLGASVLLSPTVKAHEPPRPQTPPAQSKLLLSYAGRTRRSNRHYASACTPSTSSRTYDGRACSTGRTTACQRRCRN